jgi:hypothetical protein
MASSQGFFSNNKRFIGYSAATLGLCTAYFYRQPLSNYISYKRSETEIYELLHRERIGWSTVEGLTFKGYNMPMFGNNIKLVVLEESRNKCLRYCNGKMTSEVTYKHYPEDNIFFVVDNGRTLLHDNATHIYDVIISPDAYVKHLSSKYGYATEFTLKNRRPVKRNAEGRIIID